MGGQPRKKRGGADTLAASAELAADAKVSMRVTFVHGIGLSLWSVKLFIP